MQSSDAQHTQKGTAEIAGSTIHLRGHSMKGPALQAVALLVGFYVMAISAFVALVAFPFIEVYVLHIVNCYLAIGSITAAGAILWAIIPRPDHFTPPGPRLDPTSQPRLFAVIAEVAERIGETMPDEVYLFPGVNAFVA